MLCNFVLSIEFVLDAVIDILFFSSVLGTYEQWERRVVKDQDERFVGDFLGLAMDKLGKVWRQQASHSKSTFSVMPKKIKQVKVTASNIFNNVHIGQLSCFFSGRLADRVWNHPFYLTKPNGMLSVVLTSRRQ